MFGIGPMELLLIFVVALLVFGPKRLPELARTLGRGLAEFRRASNDLRQSIALDELQQDLRRGPTTDQTIHRPGDRPAQAGGDAPTKTADATPSEARVDQTDRPKHPGELPLGNDHEHHDPEPEPGPEPEPEPEEPSETDAPDAATRATPSERTAAADPELGNVPVSGMKRSDPTRG